MIIFNLDGTLSEFSHRRYFLNTPNTSPRWQEFYDACDKDEPIDHMRNIFKAINSLENSLEIHIWTPRCVSVRDKTIEWLLKHMPMGNYFKELKMRPIGEDMKWDQLKEIWADELIELGTKIDCVFDCDSSMWKRKGVNVVKNFNPVNSILQ